jgi:hypothetical protein
MTTEKALAEQSELRVDVKRTISVIGLTVRVIFVRLGRSNEILAAVEHFKGRGIVLRTFCGV